MTRLCSQQESAVIYRATVASNEDPLRMGRLLVTIPNKISRAIWVNYASPFASPAGGGGLVAIPQPNTTVLLAEVQNHEEEMAEYIWFAAVYDNPEVYLADDLIAKGGEVYGKEGIPHKYLLKSPGGNWIEISDPYPLVDAEHEDLIRLQTSEGKRLILDSTLGKSKMILADENANGLSVVDDGGIAELKANSVHITGKDQDIYITLNDGEGDISIIHNGKGNVKVESLNGDVELVASKGSIKLQAPDIELTGDRIKIEATQRVDFL